MFSFSSMFILSPLFWRSWETAFVSWRSLCPASALSVHQGRKLPPQCLPGAPNALAHRAFGNAQLLGDLTRRQFLHRREDKGVPQVQMHRVNPLLEHRSHFATRG